MNEKQEYTRVQIFDTTLRDGEQSPGAAIEPERKIVIARQLAKLGVDVIEPGFPVSSPGEFAAVQQISRELQGVEIAGFARAVKGDIDAAVRATQDAGKRRLHLFISSSDIHLNYQLRKSREEVVRQAREMVAYGKQFVDEIEFSAMDATRSGREFVIELVEAVIAEGATIINLPDTLGYALPGEITELFQTVRKEARGGNTVRYSAHCHNGPGAGGRQQSGGHRSRGDANRSDGQRDRRARRQLFARGARDGDRNPEGGAAGGDRHQHRRNL